MANASAWKTVAKAPRLKTSPILPPNTPSPVPELVLDVCIPDRSLIETLNIESLPFTVNFFANEYLGIMDITIYLYIITILLIVQKIIKQFLIKDI